MKDVRPAKRSRVHSQGRSIWRLCRDKGPLTPRLVTSETSELRFVRCSLYAKRLALQREDQESTPESQVLWDLQVWEMRPSQT